MNKEQEIKNLEDNLLNQLDNDRVFDKIMFNEFIGTLCVQIKDDLPELERLKIASFIWEFSFLLQGYFLSDYNKVDLYEIENLNNDEKLKILEICYYVANSITFSKTIDLSFVFLKN